MCVLTGLFTCYYTCHCAGGKNTFIRLSNVISSAHASVDSPALQVKRRGVGTYWKGHPRATCDQNWGRPQLVLGPARERLALGGGGGKGRRAGAAAAGLGSPRQSRRTLTASSVLSPLHPSSMSPPCTPLPSLTPC